jgi:hypothetical protein
MRASRYLVSGRKHGLRRLEKLEPTAVGAGRSSFVAPATRRQWFTCCVSLSEAVHPPPVRRVPPRMRLTQASALPRTNSDTRSDARTRRTKSASFASTKVCPGSRNGVCNSQTNEFLSATTGSNHPASTHWQNPRNRRPNNPHPHACPRHN